MVKEGEVFYWGNNQKSVVVKVLDAESGLYYCVYHQNGLKYVVSEFSFSNNNWTLTNEPGRVIKPSEWPEYVSKLKLHV